MAWFNGNLYVGTNRDFPCVEQATIAFYFPNLGPILSALAAPEVPCPADVYANDLRAQIWRYTPGTGTWEMIFQSELIANPKEPSKPVARDIGYRDMEIFTEPGGVQALYIVGCTAREFTPGLPPPRILRMTLVNDPATGETREVFQPIPQQSGTFLGDINAVTFRATAVYNNRFYVTASPGLTGDGYLLESSTPWLGNDSFRQVTLTSLHVYELSVFNGFLYIGAGDQTNGYSVWKTTATGTPPYELTPIVTGGAGRGKVMTSVVSMYPYRGRLYVGSAGWFSTLLPSCELIRINPDDSWQLVAGNPRLTAIGMIYPISGLADGFGNPFNAHIWRMNSAGGILFAGTNDDSWALINTPLAPYFSSEFGFDLFASKDGASWTQVTRNGFGNPFSFGVRCLVPSPASLFLGSVNYVQGTEVMVDAAAGSNVSNGVNFAWNAVSDMAAPAPRRRRPSPAMIQPGAIDGLNGAPRVAASSPGMPFAPAASGPAPPETQPLDPPSRLEIDAAGKAAVLSWEPSQGAVKYRIFRSEFRRTDIGFLLGLGRPPGEHDEIPQFAEPGPGVFALPGPFVPVATTAHSFFKDRTIRAGRTYAYQVKAEDDRGRASGPSNRMTMPNFAPPASFDRARTALSGAGAGALDLLEDGRKATASGNYVVGRDRLRTLLDRIEPNEGNRLSAAPLEDASRMIAKLARRVDLIRQGVLPRDVLDRSEVPPALAPSPVRAPARRSGPVVSTPWALD
jgi:hypothetical protein